VALWSIYKRGKGERHAVQAFPASGKRGGPSLERGGSLLPRGTRGPSEPATWQKGSSKPATWHERVTEAAAAERASGPCATWLHTTAWHCRSSTGIRPGKGAKTLPGSIRLPCRKLLALEEKVLWCPRPWNPRQRGAGGVVPAQGGMCGDGRAKYKGQRKKAQNRTEVRASASFTPWPCM